MYRGKCMLQAHRGVSTEFPENTMAAFYGAAKQGYDIIELDPAVTGDGEFVILHDNTLNRTARKNSDMLSAPVYINQVTLEDALMLDVGSWFSPAFAKERIPTLNQVLDLAAETGIMLKFDNKMQRWEDKDINRFFDVVENHEARDGVGFTCSEMDYLNKVAERFPNSIVHYDGVVTRERIEAISHRIKRENTVIWLRYHNAHTAWCKTPAANSELCAMAKEYGRLGIWIISDATEADTAAMLYGADIIETTGAIKPDRQKR